MTTEELAYAAGLFEGEGCIRINKPNRSNAGGWLSVSVSNTQIEIPTFFQERWPGYLKSATGIKPQHSPAWVWTRAAVKADLFLRDVLPYFRTAKYIARATLGQEFQAQKQIGRRERVPRDEYLARQMAYYERMRSTYAVANCPAREKFARGVAAALPTTPDTEEPT